MKKLIIVILILGSIYYIYNVFFHKEYHIEVVPYFVNEEHYEIRFTENDWFTYHTIQDAFDISMDGMGNDVVKQVLLSDKTPATELAEQLKTYEDCIHYNNRIDSNYDALTNYRKVHPVNCDFQWTWYGAILTPFIEILKYPFKKSEKQQVY